LELTGAASARNWTLGTSGGTISTEGEVTQSGLLVGSGDFTKDGSGKLTVTVPINHGGATTVAAGVLALTAYATLPVATDLTVSRSATFDISGLASSTAGLTVKTLHGEDGSAIVLGEKNLTVSGIIDFTGTLTSTGGLLSGAEGSTIKLTGASTLSAIDVTATSTLIVNNTLAGVEGENDGRITIHVLNEGLLGGGGLITGNITVYDGGKLSPGNSPGALVVDGDVELKPGATLFVEITSGNGSDSVTVADTESVFLFNDASIVSVDLRGMFEPSFDWTIVTGAVAFGSGGLEAVSLPEVPGWVLTLEAGEGSKNLTLHGTQVPEPGTYGLLVGIGAVGLALIRRRKNKKK
jgi:autotransporter-associated beta strand protein